MTLKEATIAVSTVIDSDRYFIDRVSESNNYYIFGLTIKDQKGAEYTPLIPSLAVEKKSRKIITFNPIRFPDEITSIKRIS